MEEIDIRDYMKLAIKWANHYKGKGIEWEELVGEAYLGLTYAKRTFDPSRSTNFAGHAVVTIRGFIGNLFKKKANKINLVFCDTEIEHIADAFEEPKDILDVHELVNKLPDRQAYVIRQRYFREKTYKEIAAKLSISLQRVEQIERQALNNLRKQVA